MWLLCRSRAFLFLTAVVLSSILRGWCQQLPELNWVERSDWINVRTGQLPRAVGDGVADDTPALQAALDRVSDAPGRPCTVYLPPGRYRITRTLVIKQKDGISILGHGRSTRIVWDGPDGDKDDSRMIWSNGAPRSRYVGITWDGQHKACVGFDHDSKGYFETEIDHENEAFLNFTGSGIRIGHDQKRPGAQATAETTYVNCLFANCESGLSLLDFNVYNHTLAGCEFRDCTIGINCAAGPNFYVRDTHFEGSKRMDIRARGEHSLSVRRCTSVGAGMFIDEATIAPLTVQDCQISGWTNAAGAIRLGSGPVLIFDCVFRRPPNRHAPVVPSAGQHVILSQNESRDTESVVAAGASANITEVPAGKLAGALHSPMVTFFTSTAHALETVFDAKRDFGAKGDGKSDDTVALQAVIDAACKHEQNALAYLPSSDYVVTRTLEVSGSDFVVGGSGIHSRLIWRGAPGGVLLHVRNPNHVTLENLDIGNAGDQNNAVDILQTGSGASGEVHYKRIWVYGMYRKQPGRKGLHAQDLPAGTVVVADHFNGNLTFTNCARATLLFNSSYEGAIRIGGKSQSRDGFLGFLTRLATINTQGLEIQDSHSIVMSDYYVESADRLMDVRGAAGDPPGTITIQMAKSHCLTNPVVAIHDYFGRIELGPSMLYPGGVNPARLVQKASNSCDFILMACQAYQVAPEFSFTDPNRLTLLENAGTGVANNRLAGRSLDLVADALDDLRRL